MIFLYGAYGTGNLGDDAILKSALQRYGKENCKVIAYGKLFLREPIGFIDHFEFLANPERYLHHSDTLIFAGGGLFWAASHAEAMAKCARDAKAIGCDVKAERLGAQGVHVAVDAAKEFFSLCSEISVRDEHSVEVLKSTGVTDRAIYKPDFVLELRDLPPRALDSKLVTIGISHSAVPFYHDADHRKKALHVYTEIAKQSNDIAKFIYIPHTRHFNVIAQNDVIYGEYFWQASRGLIDALPFPVDVEALLEYYARVDGVIAWRYHSLVMAKILGAQAAFLGEPGGHKYGAFARENNLPQIDFRLSTAEIIASGLRFVRRIKDAKSA
ncbi:polysaccharide pyruvyl transferase family protein [Pararhizobium sp. LjRoot238]|uniref:polysaccharide pyruvyl transferase family protein n=1 Tax=Pararhizobium sp. LjRoot238 TaxID=3342293 RepID=UPI003ECE1775